MSAPDIPSYGVKLRSPASGELDSHAEEIRLVGYTILASGLDAGEIARYRERIDAVFRRQEAEFGGRDALARIGDGDTGRALLVYDDAFLALATNPRLIGVVTNLLGDYFVLNQQNSVTLQPRETHNQAQFHRDLPYQHFVATQPIAISALFCVDPFTMESGATSVIPGSHKYEPFPSDETIRRLERAVVAPAGSFIVFDSMLFHRGGANRGATPRRAVNQVYVLPFLRQQIDLPAALGGRHADDPLSRRLLGYDVRTPGSVAAWRGGRVPKP